MSIKKKTCLDCLHCKVSFSSTSNSRICFCAAAKVREDDLERYWLNNPLCERFDDMTDYTTAMVVIPTVALNNRPPLLRNSLYK